MKRRSYCFSTQVRRKNVLSPNIYVIEFAEIYARVLSSSMAGVKENLIIPKKSRYKLAGYIFLIHSGFSLPFIRNMKTSHLSVSPFRHVTTPVKKVEYDYFFFGAIGK